MKKYEYYQDIIKFIDLKLNQLSTMEEIQRTKDFYKKQLYIHMYEQRQKEIDEWLNEEIDDENNRN